MKILFATDGSDTARAALELLLRLPVPAHSQVIVTTVIDREAFPELDPELLGDEERRAFTETERAVCRDAETLLAGEGARLAAAGWAGATEVRTGHPAHEICRAAAEHAADLIVVGSHGRTGIRRYVLGSVSGGVLQYAACSVLVVPHPTLSERPPPAAGDRLRILLAFDGSESAGAALALCASLPLRERAAVTLLRVLPLVTLYRQDITQRMTRAWQEEKRAAGESLAAAADQVRWAAPDTEVLLLESDDVARTILDTATERGSDLVVLGHKGRSGIERVLLGSVAARVAGHAPCAVLAVRQPTTRAEPTDG